MPPKKLSLLCHVPRNFMGGRKNSIVGCISLPLSAAKKMGFEVFFWGGVVLSPLPFNSSGFFGGLRGQFRRWEAAGGLLQNSLCPELLFKFHHRKKSLAPGSRGSSFERTTKGDFPIFPISFKFFPLLFFFPGMTSAAVSTSWTA